MLSVNQACLSRCYRFRQASWNSLTANSPESARVYRATIYVFSPGANLFFLTVSEPLAIGQTWQLRG